MKLMSNKALLFAKTEFKKYFAKHMNERKAEIVAEQAVKDIDWNSPALMHKDITWLAKNYQKIYENLIDERM